jgi:feruloyl esterase
MLSFKLYLHGMFAIPGLPQFASADSFRESCLSFEPQIESAKVELVEFVPKGTGTALPYRDPTCGGPGVSPKVIQDVCRITLFIQTSAQSGVHFESWLPRDWNGRFLATGNGGLGGCEFLKSFHEASSK